MAIKKWSNEFASALGISEQRHEKLMKEFWLIVGGNNNKAQIINLFIEWEDVGRALIGSRTALDYITIRELSYLCDCLGQLTAKNDSANMLGAAMEVLQVKKQAELGQEVTKLIQDMREKFNL